MVGCLSENTIQELVAGLLSRDGHARAQQHIETCAECRMLAIELAHDGDLDSIGPLTTLPARPVTSPITPELAGRFEILRPLGRGGMGVVYEALDRSRGARVALKTLQHVSADGLLRFKTEFRALQDVSHPNLVTFGELLEASGQWWLTMELIEGTAFLDHVRPGRRLDERRLRAALPQLAAALSALHVHGLVHRDVKPHNVLVTTAGRVVLLDFGLVTGVAQSESNVVGTPAYMAPEQGLLQEVGPAADWYAVGTMLYQALTGALPFQGAPLQVLIAKQHELPRRPSELAHVPDDLEPLCMQLLAIEPAARLDAVAMLAGLDPGAAVASPSAALAPSPAFVGRQRELASLTDAFAGTRAGAEAIVLVQGESGIGKSALVGQFLRGLRERELQVLVLAGRCYERETVPYKGIDGVVDALARYLRKLPESDTAAVLPRRAGLLVQAFPVLGKVPALCRLPADDVIDPVELRMRAFAALRELLGRLAERCPLVVWIDDLQWADADSLELLAWVMAAPEAPPLLLLLTSRPPRDVTGTSGTETAMARVRARPGLRLLELSPLPRDAAVALAEHLLAENPAGPPASAAIVADEAAGHPLFIDALVRHTSIRAADQPPVRLSDALWARIAELDPSARKLLALMAVAGWPLTPEILNSAAELPAEEIDPALVRLRRAHLARVADDASKGAVETYHDRVREAVLDHLEPDQRKACHRALARALLAMDAARDASSPREPDAAAAPDPSSSSDASWGPEVVAVHLHAAGDLEQAARYMVLAADQAAAALAFDRAARLFRQALAFHEESGTSPGSLGDTRDVRTRLARVLVNAGRGAEAAAVYFDVARMAEAVGEEDLELRLRGAEQLLCSGHQDEGRRTLAKVLDELDLRPPGTRAGALLRLLWRRAWMRLRGFGARARSRRAAKGEPPRRELLRLEACHVAWMTTELPLEYVTRYQVLALQAGDPRCVGLALQAEVYLAALMSGAKARRIARLLDELEAAAERSADPFVRGQEQSIRALIGLMRGQWARAREHGARAVQILRERCLGASYEIAIAETHYSLALFYLGELRDFVREQQLLWRGAEERGDHFTLVMLHNTASVASLIEDQPEAARRQVDRAMEVWTTVEIDIRILAARVTYAVVDLYEGDGVAAYRRINHDWRRGMAVPLVRLPYMRAVMYSIRALAVLLACRSGALDRRLLRAVTRDARSLRAMRMAWTCALARILDAGIALAIGARAQAREQLERAHAELSAAGMNLHATLARRRLGELTGGAEGARAIAEADAWLAAQGVRAPERLARLFMPEVA